MSRYRPYFAAVPVACVAVVYVVRGDWGSVLTWTAVTSALVLAGHAQISAYRAGYWRGAAEVAQAVMSGEPLPSPRDPWPPR